MLRRRKAPEEGGHLRKQSKIYINIIAGFFIGLGVGIGWYFGFGPGRQLVPQQGDAQNGILLTAPEMNEVAPDFQLLSPDGEQLQLSSFKGKVVLINFWATWCVPCREEMPLLQSFADQYSGELVVLGINYDEEARDIQEFIDSLDLTFPILLDHDGKVTSLYRIRGFPSSIFIDKSGILRYQHVGLLSEKQLDKYLAELGLNIQ